MEQNNTPLISVIVPVYNTEKYLDQCIQSVLAQTYTNWELLLIDDGSTDSSGAICDKYAAEDNRIRVFHKENGGVSSARNLGLDNAQGEWISFVDADDILYIDAISTLYQHSCTADIITAAIEQTGQAWTHKYVGKLLKHNYIEGLLNGSIYGYPYATLYRASIVKVRDIVIPDTFKIGEDVLFKLEIAKRVNLAINIPNVVYWYRTNPDSAMQRQVRSVLYYIRYFQFRNTLISQDLAEACYPRDICTLIDAFYNPKVPYREEDYMALYNILFKREECNINLPPSAVKQIKRFRCKIQVFLSKTYHHYKTRVIRMLLNQPKYIIID